MADDPAFGTVEMACSNLAEMAGGVIAHATVVQVYAEIGYYPGLELAARSTVAFLRAMEGALTEVERSRAVIAYRRSAENIGPGQGV